MKKKGTIGLVVLLTLALLGTTIGVSADASGGGAVAAKKKKKKKCPAGTHKVVVKKKNGKKKRKCVPNPTTPPTTTTGPTPAPLVRATLTWSGGGGSTDYDLYAFDANGTKARSGADPIPNTTFSPNAIGSTGTETFTDLIFTNPGGRVFQYGVCKQGGGNDGSSYNIDYVTADGVHHTDTQSGHGDGYAAKYDGSGNPPNAPNGFTPCPAP